LLDRLRHLGHRIGGEQRAAPTGGDDEDIQGRGGPAQGVADTGGRFVHKPFRDYEIFDALERWLGVRLLRETEAPTAGAADANDEAIPARLARLAADLREALQRAALECDKERIGETIATIARLDPLLGTALQRASDDFDYQRILEYLERGGQG